MNYRGFHSFSILISLDVLRNMDCSETAHGFDAGKSYSLKCDSSCAGSVYGCPKNNGWVTADSSICAAAQMLAIPLGSQFTLVKAGEQSSYSSCTMNGYTSNAWQTYDESYRIEASKTSNFKEMIITLYTKFIQ